jgi:hypothetical protein
MQRTLNRELKELETAGRDAVVTCEERLSGRGLFILSPDPGGA